jgi:hypothetical protein
VSLINERVLEAELAKLEREGAEQLPDDRERVELPPISARRELGYPVMPLEERERLQALIKRHGLELINDGAVYRIKRQRDFMVWTLGVSPLVAEERGGGESHALLEAVRRFT